jgi:hypothetical protein
LKTRVGHPSDATEYKKYVRKFEEGNPQEWIDMLRDLEEIWTQNSMTRGTGKASLECAIAFETALQDARTAEEGQISPISVEHGNQSLIAVTETVFPHRALEAQRIWMNRKMFKPVELTSRQMAASINCLNNALPFFPTATEASKFSEIDLIGLLEWSLPATWRAKFDLDSYIPFYSRAKLIEACEAIEQSEIAVERLSREESSQSNRNIKRSAAKNSNEPLKKQKNDGKHYCSELGYNPTHSTADCYTIKNRAKAMNHTPKADKRRFSNQNLRKEINLLAKSSSKKKILEMYSSVIKREQAKLDGSKKP